MLRKAAPAQSMQKTYDECYLICSTAIYFEGQNNEAEALRAWRQALDQIYYHNAYKMPSSYSPRSETEKALHDSLRSMENQCKERVDLLDALKKSRLEADEEGKNSGSDGPSKSKESLASINKPAPNGEGPTGLGGSTIAPATYADLPRLSPAPERKHMPPPRPSYTTIKPVTDDGSRSKSMVESSTTAPQLTPPSVNSQQRTRTPSPDKKAGGMLKTLRSQPKEKSSGKFTTSLRPRPPNAAAKAATQVWAPPRTQSSNDVRSNSNPNTGTLANATWDPYTRSLVDKPTDQPDGRTSGNAVVMPPNPSDYVQPQRHSGDFERTSQSRTHLPPYPDYPVANPYARQAFSHSDESVETARPSPPPPMPPPHKQTVPKPTTTPPSQPPLVSQMGGPSSISYMKEFPNHPPLKPRNSPTAQKRADQTSDSDGPSRSFPPRAAPPRTIPARATPAVPRKAVGVASASAERQKLDSTKPTLREPVKARADDKSSPERGTRRPARRRPDKKSVGDRAVTPPTTDDSHDSDNPTTPTDKEEWDRKVKTIMKNLPKGVDEAAAKQIFNEIVIQGDEVHWDDVAGLEIAKSALKETVVYPFLRPDLFMGLREPARGMLLFGPPGTGKTMLARAVATESKSIFFAISASSLTSKFLGESEKLVRALFAIAKALAPSIIFVDEIDSLLGSRGGSSEHEATRRIKTEFLIQWSDLQKAAAGRDDSAKTSKDKDAVLSNDATRVLVLAATNTPWSIDEAARRRFVRRQYIPLPEDHVREQQLRTLLASQKHSLGDRDLSTLVGVTDGFSGSDITALAKDAAMGPLRSLGEKLLHMKPDEIRGINMKDFENSLVNIRPSVSRQGLKEFEDWAREYGERGG